MRRLQDTALRHRVGVWTHLAARFFDVVTSPPLSPTERGQVDRLLEPGERLLFFAQDGADQRHGLAAAGWVEAVGGRRELVRAALLHDVGKRHARLGPLGRVTASVLSGVGIRPGGRMGAYLRHGALAAPELAEMGSEPVVVEYAAAHHADRPPSITEEDWAVLQAADRARDLLPRWSRRG